MFPVFAIKINYYVEYPQNLIGKTLEIANIYRKQSKVKNKAILVTGRGGP
jgi:hypothetical protein